MYLRFIYKNGKYNETDYKNKEYNKFDKKRIDENIEPSLKKYEMFLNGIFHTMKFLKQLRKLLLYFCIFWFVLLLLSLLFKNNEPNPLEQSFDLPVGILLFSNLNF